MEEDLPPPAVEMKGWVEERLQEDALWRRCKETEGDGERGGDLDLSTLGVTHTDGCELCPGSQECGGV